MFESNGVLKKQISKQYCRSMRRTWLLLLLLLLLLPPTAKQFRGHLCVASHWGLASFALVTSL